MNHCAQFYLRLFNGAIKSQQIVEFLKALRVTIGKNLLIIWDGLRPCVEKQVALGRNAQTIYQDLIEGFGFAHPVQLRRRAAAFDVEIAREDRRTHFGTRFFIASARALPRTERTQMIDGDAKLSVKRQCELLELNRSGVYYTPRAVPQADLKLMRRIDEPEILASKREGRRYRWPKWKKGMEL